MTFTLGGISFEGKPLSKVLRSAIAKHEIAGASTTWTQMVGQLDDDLPVSAILEDADRTSLSGLSRTTYHSFSDDITGLSAISVWISSYSEAQIAPGVWAIDLVLTRKGN